MITHVIGIDPGLSGAISLLNADGGELFDVCDMPTRKTVKANGKRETVIDIEALAEIIIDYADHGIYFRNTHIVIEQQSTRPGLAATSVFKTGYGYGLLVGLAAAGDNDWSTIRPQDWKQWHGLIGAGGDLKGAARTRAIKTASREAAMARFPHHAAEFKRAKDDGRAEACLIADAYLKSIVTRPATQLKDAA
jgi:crossover junction endodeoxyribonuclease RuvC